MKAWTTGLIREPSGRFRGAVIRPDGSIAVETRPVRVKKIALAEAAKELARLQPVRPNPPGPIRVRIEKITTVADWRNQGVSWQTAVRRAARQAPVFVLRADGSGSLFFPENGRVRVRTWKKVSIVRPTDTARSLPALVRSL